MLNRGSEWRRWEPHIHAPGTVMNNQFSGPTAWHDYLTALEHVVLGRDPGGLRSSRSCAIVSAGRVRATSVDFERRRIPSLALPN
jgi:hypothetical protein